MHNFSCDQCIHTFRHHLESRFGLSQEDFEYVPYNPRPHPSGFIFVVQKILPGRLTMKQIPLIAGQEES